MSATNQSKGAGALDIVLGILIFTLGILVLAFRGFGIISVAILLGLAVLLLGITGIIVGATWKEASQQVRAAYLGGGLFAVILGIIGLAYPGLTVAIFIALFALALAIFGIVLLVSGIFTKKTSNTILGAIILIIAIIVIAYPGAGVFWLEFMLSIALVLAGLSRIIHGASSLRS